MRTILIVGLILIASGNVYSGEKEYTIKRCKDVTDVARCDKCKVIGKISFKISKSQDSVMKTTVLDTGEKFSVVEENCKIFDDETFECKTTIDGEISGTKMKTTFRMMLSNRKWIDTFYVSSPGFYAPEQLSRCGEEIKSDFNLFK